MPPLIPARLDNLPVEYSGDDFVVVDASRALSRHSDATYIRDPESIECIIIDQTQLPDGLAIWDLQQLEAFFYEGRKSPFEHHFVIPRRPKLDGGRSVIYRCVPDEQVAEVMAARTVSLAFGGYFATDADGLGLEKLSNEQVGLFGRVIRYLLVRYGLSWLNVYSRADFVPGRSPGRDLERSLAVYRQDALRGKRRLDTWGERQRALVELHLLKSASEIYDGETRLEIERLQCEWELPVTGLWSRPLDTRIRQLLSFKENAR